MENRTILLVYLITWLAFVVFAHLWACRKQLPHALLVYLYVIPSVVAISMSYLFLIAGGATTAQFVAGSESGMDLWSVWFHLWPVLLIACLISTAVSFVWTIIACVQKTHRKWIPITSGAFLIAVFAFFTVGLNFPDA